MSDDRYTWADCLWEAIDTGLYLAHLALVVLLTASAVACPLLLWRISEGVRFLSLREVPPCECHCRHDDGPGPVLPRVLPRLRRIGEEAAE
jgi:hypothetical protein